MWRSPETPGLPRAAGGSPYWDVGRHDDSSVLDSEFAADGDENLDAAVAMRGLGSARDSRGVLAERRRCSTQDSMLSSLDDDVADSMELSIELTAPCLESIILLTRPREVNRASRRYSLWRASFPLVLDDMDNVEPAIEKLQLCPGFPYGFSDVQTLRANGSGDLLVSSESSVVLVMAGKKPTLELSGIGKLGEKVWDIDLKPCNGESFVLRGSISGNELSGTVRGRSVGGHIRLKLGEESGDTKSFEGVWRGYLAGSSGKSPMSLCIGNWTRSSPGLVKIQASLGGYQCVPVAPSLYSRTSDPVVVAEFLPYNQRLFCVTQRSGHVRVFDSQPTREAATPLLVSRDLGASETASCTSIAFGAHLGVSERASDMTSLGFFRRLSVFTLFSDGSVVAGILPPATLLDSGSFEASLREDHRALEARDEAEYNKVLQQLAWSSNGFNEKSIPCPILVCPPSRAAPAKSVATSLLVLPCSSSPRFSLIVGWACGTVHAFYGGSALEPTFVSPSRKRQIENVMPNTQSAVAHRDSPLKDLASKMGREYQRGDFKSRSLPVDSSNLQYDGFDADANYDAAVSLGKPRGKAARSEATPLLVFPTLVGRTMVAPGSGHSPSTGFQFLPNPVFPDICVCMCRGSRSGFVLWFPWVSKRADALDRSKLGLILGRQLPPEILERGGGVVKRASILVQPGIGHRLFCFEVCDGAIDVQSIELGAPIVNMQATLAARLGPKSKSLEIANADAEVDSRDGSPEVDEYLGRFLAHFSRQLATLTYVPEPFRNIQLFGKDTPPAMTLALCTWLHEMSDSLLYGKSSEDVGLMQNISMGFEYLEEKREKQEKAFELQKQTLELLLEDLNESRGDLDQLRVMQQNLVELQQLTGEGLADAEEECGALSSTPLSAQEEFFANSTLPSYEAKVENLGALVDDLSSRLLEMKPRPKEAKLPSFRGTEMEKHVWDLQARTQELIQKMQGSGRGSVFHIRERLEAFQSSSVIDEQGGSLKEQVAVFFGFCTEGLAVLESSLGSGKFQRLCVADKILAREYQNKVSSAFSVLGGGFFVLTPHLAYKMRRLLGIHVRECPYDLALCDQLAISVRLVILGSDTTVKTDEGNVLVVGLESEPHGPASSRFAEYVHAENLEEQEEDVCGEEAGEQNGAKASRDTFSQVALLAPRDFDESIGVYLCDQTADLQLLAQSLVSKELSSSDFLRVV